MADEPSVRWCGRDDAHPAHERRNQFGGKDYCTGMSEAAAARGRPPVTADVNVTEKVARAIEDALMQPTHAPMATHDPRTGDCQACPWPVHELPPPDVAAEVAPAALSALADPEVQAGIAGVLREHRPSIVTRHLDSGHCSCGAEVANGAWHDHLADEVVEWLRGRAL